MILFLDFDGVLHPEPCAKRFQFCRLYLVEEILRDFPRVEIVLSTNWRNDSFFGEINTLKRNFSTDIATRIIGETPRLTNRLRQTTPEDLHAFQREWECVAWLRANRPTGTPWLALDDRDYWFRPLCKNLMVTDANTGFMKNDEMRFRRMLREMEDES